jgi:SAM-dependent methyltransferase
MNSREAIESDPISRPAPTRIRKILRGVPHLRETVYLVNSLSTLLSYRSPDKKIANFGDYSVREDLWGYSTAWGKNHLAVLNEMLDQAGGIGNFRHGFEVGCGEGYVSEIVARHCDSLFATDVSRIALERARERCKHFPQVRFSEWNLLTDPVPGRFDLILLMGVIECFILRREFIVARDKIVQMLEPGGMLLTTTTRQHEIFDTAWWTKWWPRGTRRIAEFLAQDPKLLMVNTLETTTHQFAIYRRKLV